MSPLLITILVSAASGSFGVLVTALATRPKVKAETKNLNVEAEVALGDSWQKWGLQMQQDMQKMRTDFELQIGGMKKTHDEEIERLKKDFNKIIEGKEKESTLKGERITTLEKQVETLEKEVAKYRSLDITIDSVRNVIHSSVDSAAQQIKDNIHSVETN